VFQNLGITEILIILLIVLLLFGAKRIPEVAGSLGKGINEFKRNMSEAQRAITEPMRDDARPIETAQRDSLHAAQPATSTPEEDVARAPKRLLS
jgi:sec-independent protein translocase protein TatA